MRGASAERLPMPSMGQQPRRRQRRLESVHGGRRIYDPRRWHKRVAGHNAKYVSNWGQPPAGWMLVWAGRFKRWRRRWFVAHPPGLLLHYKDGDQIGRPGCISLLGATASPSPGKERQMKIVRGPMVYYLRTISKDFRQGWLDAIHESIQIYNKSVQKAAVGVMPGRSLLPQQSIPQNVREEWEAQERELNSRLADRMRDLEPSCQEFLQQLQALQQSLSVISGTLGFSEKLESTVSTDSWKTSRFHAAGNGRDANANSASRYQAPPKDRRALSPDVVVRETKQKVDVETSNLLPDSSCLRSQRSNVRGITDDENMQGKKRCSKSVPSTLLSSERTNSRSKGRSFSCALDVSLTDQESAIFRERSCVSADCFKWKRKTASSGMLDMRHMLNKESGSGTHHDGCKSLIVGEINKSGEDWEAGAATSRGSEDKTDGSGEGESSVQPILTKEKDSKEVTGRFEGQLKHGVGEVENCTRCPAIASGETSGQVAKSPLHAAWHKMHEAFAEALKGEIHRVVELEAENTVLQESLALLPDLKKDRRDLLSLRESLQSTDKSDVPESKTSRTTESEYDEEGRDSDEETSIVQSDYTDEEYFEALEVVNQHDYIAKSSARDDQEDYSDKDDSICEPPEEGDLPADAESEAEGDEVEQPRTRLPAPRPLSRGFSLWTVLKNAIGKDLNHITMPATINEPLSVLQKCAEEMQYRYLLEKAAEESSSAMRMLYVSTFACASYHGSIYRDAKPFNPMLGETYEWLAPDEKSWFFAEQVSHHPPIMAFHSESAIGDYTIYGDMEIKNKFWGKSVEVLPTGVCHLHFKEYADHFTWRKVTTCAHNVVVGKLWIDNYGELVIKNHATGDVSRIRFHKAGSKEHCRITGKVYDRDGVPQFSIHGNYQDKICARAADSDVDGADTLMWEKPKQIEDFHQQYCFSKFSLGLNELTPKLAEILPPTDSRFRPDQRALEDGDLEKATPEKLRLEDKQRQARKTRSMQKENWKTQWFEKNDSSNSQIKSVEDPEQPSWVYQGTYWKAREEQDWGRCADIM